MAAIDFVARYARPSFRVAEIFIERLFIIEVKRPSLLEDSIMCSHHAINDTSNSTIVVVDDEPVLLSMMEDIISELGFKPQPFSQAADALLFITESRNEVRLLLTDFCMPGSMSGGELALNVTARFPDLPIIVTSGFLDSAFQMGPEVVFVAKPWSFDTMAALIKKLTGGPNS